MNRKEQINSDWQDLKECIILFVAFIYLLVAASAL